MQRSRSLRFSRCFAHLRALVRAIIQKRKVRPLGHQHHTLVTEVGGLIDERIERELAWPQSPA